MNPTSFTMRRPLLAGWAGLCIFIAGLAMAVPADAEECEYELDLIQLTLETGALIESLESTYEVWVVDELHPSYLMGLPLWLTPEQVIGLLELDPLVRTVEFAFRSETPEGVQQMMVGAVGGSLGEYVDQSISERIQLGPAHVHTTGAGVRVAVIDTGVKADHEALVGSVSDEGYDFVDDDTDPDDEASELDEDGDGLTDDAAGHGTMVAGMIHLMAPDAEILPIRVLDDEGRGLTFDVAKGIRYAVDHGSDVINLSLGLSCESSVLRRELEYAADAGVHLVAAAGNDGTEDPPFYPASDELVLSVAALDSADVRATFSSYHPTVSISAPGVGVYGPFHDGQYAVGEGTSFAAPFIAGQLALIRSVDPNLNREEVQQVATAGVVEIYDIPENQPYLDRLGSGRVDAFRTWEETLVASDVSGPGWDHPGQQLLAAPNPSLFGSVVSFRVASAEGRDVKVSDQLLVLDAAGRIVRRLQDDGSGWTWDGLNSEGKRVPSGTYWAKPERSGRVTGPLRFVIVR